MQKGEHFEHYTPQFPLPSDITNMSRQDTVCQFCGVSYLIHNEIKALETKCQKLEADLAYYAGMNSREAKLEEKLQNERLKILDLESTININTHRLNEMSRKLQLAEDEFQQSENAHQETKIRNSTNLRTIYKQLQNIRQEYLSLKDSYSKTIQNLKTYLQTTVNTLQKEIQTTIDKSRTETEQYHHQLQSFQNLQQTHIVTQDDLKSAQKEIENYQNELIHLRQQLLQFEQTKEYSQQLEQQLIDKDEMKKNIDFLQQQLTNEKQLRLQTDHELENLRLKFDQLNTSKSEYEMNELNNRRKLDEMNRSRQAVLDRTRDEYEKLLRKYTDLDEVYRELIDLRGNDASESKNLRSELERLHNENIELTKQRETLLITHDVQTKKLHDSYSIKLREAEQWPDRLQSELNHEREQHRIQMNELERRLKESFLTELNIEKQKSADLLRKYEHESDYSTKQLRHELISTEKVTIEQRNYYTKQIEQLEKDKESLKTELDKLRDVLKDLHEQLKKQEAVNNEQGNYLQLKEDLITKEKNLFQSQTIIDQLEKELEQTREEMNTLQETVHKECTEREQLKDALIDARQQLLTLKKNGVLNGTASRSLHSPPVAFEDIEKRVNAPLPYSSQNTHRSKLPSFIQSEPIQRDNSIPDEAADLTARPITQRIPYRSKALPPITRSQQTQQQQQQPSKQRRNGNIVVSHKPDPLLENQRRIARFIKHIK